MTGAENGQPGRALAPASLAGGRPTLAGPELAHLLRYSAQ